MSMVDLPADMNEILQKGFAFTDKIACDPK